VARVSKRRATCGIVRTAGVDASSVTSGDLEVFPTAESIQTESVPHSYERPVNQQADPIAINRTGFDHTFSIDGMVGSTRDIGYLFALMWGDDIAAVSDVQTVTPAADGDGEYFTLWHDRKNPLVTGGTSKSVEAAEGCKITSFTLEQQPRDYAKVSLSGLFCGWDDEQEELTTSISTAADDQPIDWAALSAGSAFVKFDDTPAQRNEISSFKFECTREAQYAGIQVNTEQPTGIIEGGRELMFECTMDWGEGTSTDQYGWFKNDTELAVDVRWDVGSTYLRINIPKMRIVGTMLGETGPGAETIKATFTCKAANTQASIIGIYCDDPGSGTTPWW
jgi:hypothetical protein